MKPPSWGRGLFVFVALFIAALVAFVLLTLRNRFDLVAPDYYDQEIRYQDRIDALQRTQTIAREPVLRYNAATRALELVFPHPGPLTGTLTLYRPSDKSLDRTLALQPDDAGRQRVDLADLAPGPWRIQAAWTKDGVSYYAEELMVLP